MPNDQKAVHAALHAAASETRVSLRNSSCVDDGICRFDPCDCAINAAGAAVTTFLRALPPGFLSDNPSREDFARAIEEAANGR